MNLIRCNLEFINLIIMKQDTNMSYIFIRRWQNVHLLAPLQPLLAPDKSSYFKITNNQTYLLASLLWGNETHGFPSEIFESWYVLVNFVEILILGKISNTCAFWLICYRTHSAISLITKFPKTYFST